MRDLRRIRAKAKAPAIVSKSELGSGIAATRNPRTLPARDDGTSPRAAAARLLEVSPQEPPLAYLGPLALGGREAKRPSALGGEGQKGGCQSGVLLFVAGR